MLSSTTDEGAPPPAEDEDEEEEIDDIDLKCSNDIVDGASSKLSTRVRKRTDKLKQMSTDVNYDFISSNINEKQTNVRTTTDERTNDGRLNVRRSKKRSEQQLRVCYF